jgi:diguanylate cyclase (GGDEF)-like protein
VLISIKKYLDRESERLAVGENESQAAVVDCYRSLLLAIGKSAVRACQGPGTSLEQHLTTLEGSVAQNSSASDLKEVERHVEERLDRWGQLTAEHLKTKADEVRELLLMMAGTAESVGERDQRYANQFCGLTADLNAIADLDDLTVVRSSLLRKASELKSCVDQMTQEGQHSLTALLSKVSRYESKLKVAEQLAMKDPLTGLANRRGAEGRMDWYVSERQTYCVVIVDMDSFKQVNDSYGHAAGDELLRNFSEELQNNTRSTDMVARWGGDEFIVVLPCDLPVAKAQIERIREWALGDYTLLVGVEKKELKIRIGASLGAAQWVPGESSLQVIERADAAMYLDKKDRSPLKKNWI